MPFFVAIFEEFKLTNLKIGGDLFLAKKLKFNFFKLETKKRFLKILPKLRKITKSKNDIKKNN